MGDGGLRPPEGKRLRKMVRSSCFTDGRRMSTVVDPPITFLVCLKLLWAKYHSIRYFASCTYFNADELIVPDLRLLSFVYIYTILSALAYSFPLQDLFFVFCFSFIESFFFF